MFIYLEDKERTIEFLELGKFHLPSRISQKDTVTYDLPLTRMCLKS